MKIFALFLLFLLGHSLAQSVEYFADDSEEMEDYSEEMSMDRRDRSSISISSEEGPGLNVFIKPQRPPPRPRPTTTEAPSSGRGPKNLSPAEKARLRAEYVQFLGQLDDAKSQAPGLKGKWGSRITENLVLLNSQQIQKLNGDAQGPEEDGKTFLGDGPLNLRQIQQASESQQQHESELTPVGTVDFNFDEGDSQGNQFRVKRQQQQQPDNGVTCQEFVFDVRQKWPQCAHIINNVRDQSLCGDCWAVSASSSFSDRRCIQQVKQGLPIDDTERAFFSAYDTAVCSDAVDDKKDGCNGGSHALAWRWYTNTGVVSGGNNDTQGGCKPYPFPPTDQADQDSYQALVTECQAACTNTDAQTVGTRRKAKAISWNYLYGDNGWEEVMKNELFQNGSISASIIVFEDFKTYSGGVYSHVMGAQKGGHAIRLIGYGNITCSDGSSQKYWLGVNSWNTTWGLDGLFKIARGVNECGIESRQISYGIPSV